MSNNASLMFLNGQLYVNVGSDIKVLMGLGGLEWEICVVNEYVYIKLFFIVYSH